MTQAERNLWLMGLAVAAAGAFAYQNSFSGSFLFDDRDSILGNPTIRHLGQWRSVLHPPAGGLTVTGRPAINWSLALNWAWSGSQVWSYHLFNLLGHLAAALALFAVSRRTLLRVEKLRPSAPVIAGWVALLWVLQPMQTESVTYIVQRAEMLMGLCYLSGLWCLTRTIEAQERSRILSSALWGVGCILFCAVGMTCKEVMVSAPVIFLLYDRVFVSLSWAASWGRRRWLWLGLAATWGLLIPEVFFSESRGGTAGFGVGVPFWQYWLTQGPAIVHYLALVAWPHPLVLDYALRKDWLAHPGIMALGDLAVAALAGLSLILLRRAPRWGFLGFWFFSILAPTSLVPGNRQTLAEHRMYLALAPLLAAIVAALWLTTRGRPVGRRIAGAGLLIVAAGWTAVVRARNRDYYSEEGMWRKTIAQMPANPYAYTNLGGIFYLAGRYREAEAEFARAAALDPKYPVAESDWGMALYNQGKRLEAMAHYRRAMEIGPTFPQAANNLGLALASLGRWGEAAAADQRAIKINPRYPDALENLGLAEIQLGRFSDAEIHLRAALALEPERVPARVDLAVALRLQNRLSEAEEQSAEALQRDPHNKIAELNWGMGLMLQGQTQQALGHLNSAVKLDPTYGEAYLNRGLALAALGQSEAAMADYRSAVAINPASAEALANLGTAQFRRNQISDALRNLQEAARLAPGNARIRYDLSLALAASGDQTSAQTALAETLRLDPTLAEARNNLAVNLAAQGRLEEARRELAEVVRQSPNFIEGHRNLSRLYQALGRDADAKREAESAARLEGAPPR